MRVGHAKTRARLGLPAFFVWVEWAVRGLGRLAEGGVLEGGERAWKSGARAVLRRVMAVRAPSRTCPCGWHRPGRTTCWSIYRGQGSRGGRDWRVARGVGGHKAEDCA